MNRLSNSLDLKMQKQKVNLISLLHAFNVTEMLLKR